MTFPWTVSLTDPLLIHIVTIAKRCYCVWRAFVTWRSGSKSGRIAIDNGGKGYEVFGVGRRGLPAYVRVRDTKWIKSRYRYGVTTLTAGD
jgi:hypothetical protein